ncbi:sugar O-acetyltransferase [Alkalibacterium pelagium]|uniref:Maltose O-acetyltransferase n=1 Tax=Alkalibacterium pelagium TaxID=426702 RepID=A0A1H7PQ68_9LACT|nr:sugar O-acetyltransferase [Alkalibacterium pelagium]GEN51689.1 maltose O-acetyltransferase [Alkalibacterium pelagium]SEL37554.1 maltose O-acetyltransferase [Alkalibacterium pelagium]
MRSEKEKKQNGELYDPMDQELVKERERAHRLTHMYNQLEDEHARGKWIKEIFQTIEGRIKVEPGLRVDYGYNIHVGDHFYANFHCILLDAGEIRIGKNALLGPGVSLVTPDHPMDSSQRFEGLEYAKPIVIGDNCWLGAGATVIGGVTLGNNVVVGAGAVVTRSFGDNVVLAGVPARVIRTFT